MKNKMIKENKIKSKTIANPQQKIMSQQNTILNLKTKILKLESKVFKLEQKLSKSQVEKPGIEEILRSIKAKSDNKSSEHNEPPKK